MHISIHLSLSQSTKMLTYVIVTANTFLNRTVKHGLIIQNALLQSEITQLPRVLLYAAKLPMVTTQCSTRIRWHLHHFSHLYLASGDKMRFVTHSPGARGVFHQYVLPSSSPLCDSGTLHHQAATNTAKLSTSHTTQCCAVNNDSLSPF